MLEREHLIICLAEPSLLQAKLIQTMLNNMGCHHVQTASSGAEVLAMLDNPVIPPDLVISSLYLPDMTGTDLVYKMRENHNWRDIPFLLASSETKTSYLEPVRQAGVMAILPKPFTATQLAHAINNTVDFINAEEHRADVNTEIQLEVADLTVLLVDDSKAARHHIRNVLTRIGFERIIEAADGIEAIPHLNNTLFDLVVTDYNMPEMDGKALVQHIRTLSMQPSVPILMVSSERDEGRLAAVEQAGVSAICDKPFEVNLIRRLLKNLFADQGI